MVKPLGNVKFVCKQCGWSKAMHFDSDVIFGEPQSCPKCGNKEFRLDADRSIKKKMFDLVKAFRNS
ncbi:hypothetical protein A1QU_11410 [Vibrio anguillarum]|nr:hypothetical protein A1QU_11410 [Vibrio anguillarum]